ncbi:MAG: FAD-dependent oxidoreductase [Desulfobacterales bacterium]|nr:FAD-dependent oxidoreductase [Desulfobacterales bacterium]
MEHNKPKIGVYICHCGMNISPKVNVEEVSSFTGEINNVTIARDYKFMCSNPGQELITEDIKNLGLNRVVVASCSPRMHELTFRKACENAGLNQFYFQMANIREHSSWVTKDSAQATKKAKELVFAAISRVAFHAPLDTREVDVKKSVVIIGGGIAGMQAALTSAEAGFDVHLVEREPSIGGHMSKFDKTFPTLDCAACISTPKTVNIGQHPNINLLSYSEVSAIEGFVGNYNVTVKRKARFISEEKCTGCGLCTEVCPVNIRSDFDEGLSNRKAAYRSFPQAVPLTFCIDKKDTAPCRTGCPAELNVQGYLQLVGMKKYREAIDLIMERVPLPGVLGRVCPHPCESKCRRIDVDSAVSIRDMKRFAADQVDFESLDIPEIIENDKKIAIIGSGPAGLTVAYDMRLKGYKVTIFEAMEKAGGMLRVGIPDYRLPQNVLDEEINHLLRHGIDIKYNSSFGKDFTTKDLLDEGYDSVFLGIGAHKTLKMRIQGENSKGVLDAVSFLRDVNTGSTKKPGEKVVIIGGGNVAIDAAGVSKRLGSIDVTILYRRTEKEMPAFKEEIDLVLDEGVNLTTLVSPVKIVEQNGVAVGIECIKNELGPADASGRRRPVPIEGSEYIIDCDAVIPAIGQEPDISWFEKEPELTLSKWNTIETNTKMQTAIPEVFAGGDGVTGPATVIEAIAAGHRASESMDKYLSGEILDEIEEPIDISKENNFLDIPSDYSKKLKSEMEHLSSDDRKVNFNEISMGLTESQSETEAERCLNCGGCCECMECVKACEVEAIDHAMEEEEIQIETGAVILSTGFKAFDPSPMTQYGYGIYPEVYTSLEFERLNNATGPTSGKVLMKNGEVPKKVAIVHCVGSRDDKHNKFCSRVCCMYSMKFAHLLKEKTGAEVWEFYIDIRSPGKLYEEFYNRVQEEGVHFIRGRVAEITDIPDNPEDRGKLTVIAENTLTRRTARIPVDMVILGVGLNPAEGSDDVGRMAGVSRDGDGWYNELHAKLAPVSTPINGIFLAGCCQGPKDIPDTVAQSMGAAGEAIALLSKGTVKTMAEISEIDPDICSGCKTCLTACSYSAITFNDSKNIAVVNEALCQGCGSCSVACPSSSASVKHFNDIQVMNEIEALL